MDLFSIYLLQTPPIQRAAGSHAGMRAHAWAGPSARPNTSGASPGGLVHGRGAAGRGWPTIRKDRKAGDGPI